MRHLLRTVLATLLAAGASPVAAQTLGLDNLLKVCSNPETPPAEALNACWTAAEKGRLDARRRAMVWMNAGIAAYALKRYESAAEAHGHAIEADPGLAAAFVSRAQALEKLDRLPEALADFAAAISLEPVNPDGYLGRGALMLGRGVPERALPDFIRALELDPESLLALYNRGLAYLQLGSYPAAEADFSVVIGRNPREAGAYLNRARARAVQDKPGARNDFDRAIALQPEWAVAWYLRGRYLDATGAVEAANADFQRAYELGHSDPWLIERMRTISGG